MNAHQSGAWRMLVVTIAAPIALADRLGGLGITRLSTPTIASWSHRPTPSAVPHMDEVVGGAALDPGLEVAFMLDQCHNIEPKMPGQLRSVMNVQKATAKALLVDRDALREAQRAGNGLGANGALVHACNTGVRPPLAEIREEMGLDPDPLGTYRRSGYERIASECVGEVQAGWGA
jgi:hypothetical protein